MKPGQLMGDIEAVRMFEWYAADRLQKEPHWLDELHGHDLACYCRPSKPCHVDILLRLANPEIDFS